MCSVTNISATLTPIGMKVCVTADLSFGHKVSPFSGDNFRGDQMRDQKRKRGSFFKQKLFDLEYLANRESESYM